MERIFGVSENSESLNWDENSEPRFTMQTRLLKKRYVKTHKKELEQLLEGFVAGKRRVLLFVVFDHKNEEVVYAGIKLHVAEKIAIALSTGCWKHQEMFKGVLIEE